MNHIPVGKTVIDRDPEKAKFLCEYSYGQLVYHADFGVCLNLQVQEGQAVANIFSGTFFQVHAAAKFQPVSFIL